MDDPPLSRPISSPINGNEASKLQYVSSYLVAGVIYMRASLNFDQKKASQDSFAIDLFQTAKAVGVTEVEDEEMNANFCLRTSVGMTWILAS
ncbi:unnamed protein product [Rhizophagus irregularis]|nr:unnamed protein product [Rhizophagus irregularis]CAB4429583.1 unnamed protein product [Rhizophagus irregularis]CAB4436231.1 unnamed protein product [Rhizophagus irregularis]